MTDRPHNRVCDPDPDFEFPTAIRSWEKISRSALPYYLRVSDPAVRVRRAWACPSLWADNGGLGFISSTVYLCPVRRVHAFALADNAGRYWITPEWTACGPLFHRFPEGHTDVQGNPLIVDTFHMTADGEEGRPHYGHQLPLTQEMFEGWTFHEKARATHEAMERYRGYYNEEGSAVFPRDGSPYSDDKSDFTYLDPRLGSIGYWMARASVVWVFDREHGAGAYARSVKVARARHDHVLSRVKEEGVDVFDEYLLVPTPPPGIRP